MMINAKQLMMNEDEHCYMHCSKIDNEEYYVSSFAINRSHYFWNDHMTKSLHEHHQFLNTNLKISKSAKKGPFLIIFIFLMDA